MEDWPLVANIYAEGIATGNATFESQVPDYESWNSSHLECCRFVAVDKTTVLGWVALSAVSGRCVYGGVAELSVYIAAKARGKGLGKALLQEVIDASEKQGFWTLQAGIFPTNKASIALHERLGFRFIGKREKVAKSVAGVWTDNLLFERRSKMVGLN